MSFIDILIQLTHGLFYTVLVTVVCSVTGLIVGLSLASLRRLNFQFITPAVDCFTYVFRGVPVLVLLFLVYFGLPGIGVRVPSLIAMALSLGLVASAYLAEVFRGAFNSIDQTEILAAQAMGMTRLQALIYIELPQILRISVPGMMNEFTTVLKYSPFAYTVGIPEMTKQAMSLTATTLKGIEVYLAVGIMYFVIYRICLFGVKMLSKRYEIPGLGTI